MTIKHRIHKLENKLGIKQMYVFEMRDGMASGAIEDQFCRENNVDKNEVNLFIFIRRFGETAQDWKFLYQTAI